jgi:hypothetical protein
MNHLKIIFHFALSLFAIHMNAQTQVSPNKDLFKNQKIELEGNWLIDSTKYGYLFLRDTIENNIVKVYTEENAGGLDAKIISSNYYNFYLTDTNNVLIKDSIITHSNFNGYWTLLKSKNIFDSPIILEFCVINFGTRTFFLESSYEENSDFLLKIIENTSYFGHPNSHLRQKQKYYFLNQLSIAFDQECHIMKVEN